MEWFLMNNRRWSTDEFGELAGRCVSTSYCFSLSSRTRTVHSSKVFFECDFKYQVYNDCNAFFWREERRERERKSKPNLHLIACERALLVLNVLACTAHANELLLRWKPFIGRSNKSVTVHHHHHRLLNTTTTRAPSRRRILFLVHPRGKINDAYSGSPRWAGDRDIYISRRIISVEGLSSITFGLFISKALCV